MSALDLATLGTVLLFVLVHVLGDRLDFLSGTPRNAWLSAAGGVSVAYVFVHLLPDLAQHQSEFGEEAARGSGLLSAIENHIYVVALLGLAAFYGVEHFARTRSGSDRDATPFTIFWTHLGAFALYNLLIGYLLVHREETNLRSLLIYAVAMSLHFTVNDQSLRAQHGHTYHRFGRWLLAACPLIGYLIGIATEISAMLLASLFAFLAGGIVLNVLKEELPEQRRSRFGAFAAGATFYAALLMLTA